MAACVRLAPTSNSSLSAHNRRLSIDISHLAVYIIQLARDIRLSAMAIRRSSIDISRLAVYITRLSRDIRPLAVDIRLLSVDI